MPDSIASHTVPLTAVMVALQGFLVVVIVPSVWALMKKLRDISHSLSSIEQWKTDHEKETVREAVLLDTTKNRVEEVQAKLIDSLHKRIDDLKQTFVERRE